MTWSVELHPVAAVVMPGPRVCDRDPDQTDATRSNEPLSIRESLARVRDVFKRVMEHHKVEELIEVRKLSFD
jgi:hypothetical protein